MLARDADTTVRSVPGEIGATRTALGTEIQSTRRDLLATVNTLAMAIQKHHAVEVKRRDGRVFVLFRGWGSRVELALYEDLAPSLADAARIERLLMEKHKNPDNRCGARQMDIYTELINLKLSRTEARIALATFQGKTPKEYAHLARIAESTARWHVRQIYKKLGVHRQADFMRLLLERLNQ